MTDIEKYNVKSQVVKASENEAFLKQLNITDNLTLTSKCKALHFDFNVKLLLMLSFIQIPFLSAIL